VSALAQFRSELPVWRPIIEAWLDELPATVRNDPCRAAVAYLLASPPIAALGSEALCNLDYSWVDWAALDHRAQASGEAEVVLVAAARNLADDDPGLALGLMLVFPHVDAFRWGHAAGTVHAIVQERVSQHPLATR
jgi:phage tail protein X